MCFDEKLFQEVSIEIEFSNSTQGIYKEIGTDELQKIIESEILSNDFKQKSYPADTFDEDFCVICNDHKNENSDLQFVIFMPCRHSVVCFECSKEDM
jgi:hypothetical protein